MFETSKISIKIVEWPELIESKPKDRIDILFQYSKLIDSRKLKLLVLENGKIINLMKSKILPIAGDASFRKFYRFISKKSSKIIVFAKKKNIKI